MSNCTLNGHRKVTKQDRNVKSYPNKGKIFLKIFLGIMCKCMRMQMKHNTTNCTKANQPTPFFMTFNGNYTGMLKLYAMPRYLEGVVFNKTVLLHTTSTLFVSFLTQHTPEVDRQVHRVYSSIVCGQGFCQAMYTTIPQFDALRHLLVGLCEATFVQ